MPLLRSPFASVVYSIVAFLVGLLAGSAVNMGLVLLGPVFVPPPPGVDPSDADSIARSIHLFEARHFAAPFFAHAAGTLAGAWVGYRVAGGGRAGARIAYAIAALFFVGGIAASTMIPAPVLFIAIDLVLAYFPMAALAVWAGRSLERRRIEREPAP